MLRIKIVHCQFLQQYRYCCTHYTVFHTLFPFLQNIVYELGVKSVSNKSAELVFEKSDDGLICR